MTESCVVRVGASTELLIQSKLDGPLRQSSVQTRPKTDTVRAKATTTPKWSLPNKLGRVTASEFGRGATVDGDPKACQGTEGNLHDEASSDRPHAQGETSTGYQPGPRSESGAAFYSLI